MSTHGAALPVRRLLVWPGGVDLWRGIREYPLAVLAVIFALWQIGVPLAMLLMFSFRGGTPTTPGEWSFEQYVRGYSNPAVYVMFFNTALLALGSTAISLAIAVGLAYLTERTDMPFRHVAWGLALLPLAIPTLAFGMGWVLLLNPANGAINTALRALLALFGLQLTEGPLGIFSLGGLIFLESLVGVTTLFLMVTGAMRTLDPALEDSAQMSGASFFQTVRRVTLPILTPALFGAFIYGFMSRLESLEIPMIVGVPAKVYVFSSYIYFTGLRVSPPDYGVTSALGVTFLVASLGLLIWYRRVTALASRFATVTGKGYRPRLMRLGKWRYPCFGLFLLYFLLVVLLPFLALLWRSLIPFNAAPSHAALERVSLNNYVLLVNNDKLKESVSNTAVVALGTAFLTMVVCLVVAWVIVRTRLPGRALLDAVTFLPHAIPGVLVGLALLVLYLQFPMNLLPVYGTVLIIVLGLTTVYLAFGTRLMNAAVTQIHQELEEAAVTSGAPWSEVMRRVLLPLVLPAFVAGWVWVAAHALRSFSVPLMLRTTQNEVIAVSMWRFWSENQPGEATALAVLLMVLVGALTIAGRSLVERTSRQE